MANQNVGQKPKTTIAVMGKVLYYTKALETDILLPGLYKMQPVRVGDEIQPGYLPVDVNNDRPLEIDGSVQEILKEMQDFFERRHIFQEMGFSHKRGYLLHGPPGCGKSSTLRLLEEKFVSKFEGIVLFWSPGSNVEFFYEHIRDHEPTRPVMVVCEDIDGVIGQFEEGILEFLDGQKALDNFVLVATTNNLGNIPSRIKDRPSRVDRLLEIGLPSEATRYEYLRRLKVQDDVAKDLAKRTEKLSIAQLKEIVVATVCLGQPIGPVLERLKVADMSPLEVTTDPWPNMFPYQEE